MRRVAKWRWSRVVSLTLAVARSARKGSCRFRGRRPSVDRPSPSRFSARWKPEVLERLDRRSERAGTSKSRLAERYFDEGTRMDEHSGTLFRGGPTGRRAALAGGPMSGR